MPEQKTITFQLRFSASEYAALNLLAVRDGVGLAEELRQALRDRAEARGVIVGFATILKEAERAV